MTDHQKRILAAMLELERRHGLQWWSRDAIGSVVGAGGYHSIIQKRTMLAMSAESFVLLEVESWPAATRKLVRCNCAAYRWGLTEAGRNIAASMSIRWTERAIKAIGTAKVYDCEIDDSLEGRTTKGDRFVPRPVRFRDDEDDDPADFWKT